MTVSVFSMVPRGQTSSSSPPHCFTAFYARATKWRGACSFALVTVRRTVLVSGTPPTLFDEGI